MASSGSESLPDGSPPVDGHCAGAMLPTGVSPDDIAKAVAVLRAVADRLPTSDDALHHPEFSPLVDALKSFAAAAAPGRRRDGPKLSRQERREARKKTAMELQAAARAKDLNLVNSTGLRAGRKRRVAELEAADAAADVDGVQNTRVPDGPGDDSMCRTADSDPQFGLPLRDTAPVSPGADDFLSKSRPCYICRRRFVKLHTFYDSLCGTCAEFNFAKRTQTADLTGRIALVTGARIKVGFHVALKLLHAGATVIATSRFPRDALRRFSAQPDANTWLPRLTVCELELRDLRAVEAFCASLCATLPRLDIIINNAAQTIRRPSAFYADVSKNELTLEGLRSPAQLAALSRGEALTGSTQMAASARIAVTTVTPHTLPLLEDVNASLLVRDTNAARDGSGCSSSHDVVVAGSPRLVSPRRHVTDAGSGDVKVGLADDSAATSSTSDFPPGAIDAHGQQLDLRKVNSWVLPLPDLETSEVAEVFVVNAIAPMAINARLWPLLTRGRDGLLPASGRVPASGVAPPSLEEALEALQAGAGGLQAGGGAAPPTSSAQRRSRTNGSAHGGVSSPLPADACRFVVNVSAMEGRFYRPYKHAHHPHTNAAKAALNMMVRTSAADAAASAVFMNAVDTGWVTLEHPVHIAARIVAAGFQPPLDEIDAAARVLDPIFAPLAAAQGLPPSGGPAARGAAVGAETWCDTAAEDGATAAGSVASGTASPAPLQGAPRPELPPPSMQGLCTPVFGAFLKDYFAGAW